MDYLVGPLPMGPQTAIRPLKDICHREDNPFHDRSLGDIEELPLFLSREVGPIAHAMEVSMHSCVLSLLISLSPHRNFWGLLSPRLASLSLSATTDHSDVFGWHGNAITQDCLFYQSTISMFREKIQINGDPQGRLFISYISSMHIDRVSWPSIPVCPILLEAFSNGSLIHHSEQADPDVDYSSPQRRRKLYGRVDHLPWPRSVFLFTEWRYRVDREIQWYIGCVLASTEI